MAKKKATTPDATDEELAELANFGAAFDTAKMYELEAIAGGNEIGMQRRMMLGALTRTADELCEFSKTDQGAYAEMRSAIEGFKMHAAGVLEAAEAAALRVAIADIRGGAAVGHLVGTG